MNGVHLVAGVDHSQSDGLADLGHERLRRRELTPVDHEAEVRVAEQQPVVAICGEVTDLRYDLECAVEALADVPARRVRVVPMRAGRYRGPLIRVALAGLDERLGDAGYA